MANTTWTTLVSEGPFINNSGITMTSTISTAILNDVTNQTVTTCNNETSSLYDDIVGINRSVTPFIYAVGFPGNILSFLIWIRPRMRHSSGVYLSALALVDFIFLFLHLLFELNEQWQINTLNHPGICESFTVVFLTFQYLAPLLVLAFTIERYISICHPFKRDRFCTTRRAQIVSLSLAIGSLAICAIQGYFWTYSKGPDGVIGCHIREATVKDGNNSFWNIWSWVTEMIMSVVPLCVLAFNILVIKEARRMSRYEHNQLQGKSQKTQATTIMLLAVSFYLIFSIFPVTVVYVIVFNFPEGPDCVSHETNPVWRQYYGYLLVRAIVEEIGITHFALNFYIYMLTGKMFRKEVKKMFVSVLGKTLPEKVRTEYTSLRTSFRGSFKKNMTVRANGSTTTADTGGETTCTNV